MKHLKGISFPASKREILNHAEHGAGPDTEDVMGVLRQIDDGEYGSPAEIMKQVGEIE